MDTSPQRRRRRRATLATQEANNSLEISSGNASTARNKSLGPVTSGIGDRIKNLNRDKKKGPEEYDDLINRFSGRSVERTSANNRSTKINVSPVMAKSKRPASKRTSISASTPKTNDTSASKSPKGRQVQKTPPTSPRTPRNTTASLATSPRRTRSGKKINNSSVQKEPYSAPSTPKSATRNRSTRKTPEGLCKQSTNNTQMVASPKTPSKQNNSSRKSAIEPLESPLTTTIKPANIDALSSPVHRQSGAGASGYSRSSLFKDLTDSSEFEDLLNQNRVVDQMSDAASSKNSVMGVPHILPFNLARISATTTANGVNSPTGNVRKRNMSPRRGDNLNQVLPAQQTRLDSNQVALYNPNGRTRFLYDQFKERQTFVDMNYQKKCLMESLDAMILDESRISHQTFNEELQVEFGYPLPNPEIFDAIVRFNHTREPIFEFYLPSKGSAFDTVESMKNLDKEMLELSKTIYALVYHAFDHQIDEDSQMEMDN